MKIWKTKGSRFNKYRRYRSKNYWSLFSISLLTIYLLALNLLLYFPVYTFTDRQVQAIPLLSVILSVFILILSLLEASKQYILISERLYTCSNELTNLYTELQYFKSRADYSPHGLSKLEKIMLKYDMILSKCPDNHDSIDLEVFKTEHPEVFACGCIEKKWIYIKAFFLTYALYLFLICMPPLVLLLYLIS